MRVRTDLMAGAVRSATLVHGVAQAAGVLPIPGPDGVIHAFTTMARFGSLSRRYDHAVVARGRSPGTRRVHKGRRATRPAAASRVTGHSRSAGFGRPSRRRWLSAVTQSINSFNLAGHEAAAVTRDDRRLLTEQLRQSLAPCVRSSCRGSARSRRLRCTSAPRHQGDGC
jgi:hypothetical protein